MTSSEFYGWAIPQLIDAGISVKLLNKSKSLNCGGWFSEEKKELVACTKHVDAFSIFIHEFCHFLQFRDDPKIWNNVGTGTDYFFAWLKGKKYNNVDIEEFTTQSQELERDCEARAVKLIKKLKIDIDINEYIRKANAYLFSYRITKDLRLWPNTSFSVYDQSVSEYFDSTLATLKQLKDKNNIPKEVQEIWLKKCYRLDSSKNKE